MENIVILRNLDQDLLIDFKKDLMIGVLEKNAIIIVLKNVKVLLLF